MFGTYGPQKFQIAVARDRYRRFAGTPVKVPQGKFHLMELQRTFAHKQVSDSDLFTLDANPRTAFKFDVFGVLQKATRLLLSPQSQSPLSECRLRFRFLRFYDAQKAFRFPKFPGSHLVRCSRLRGMNALFPRALLPRCLLAPLGLWCLPAAPARADDRTLPMRFDLRQQGPAENCGEQCAAWIFASGAITADSARDFKQFMQGFPNSGRNLPRRHHRAGFRRRVGARRHGARARDPQIRFSPRRSAATSKSTPIQRQTKADNRRLRCRRAATVNRCAPSCCLAACNAWCRRKRA